LEIRVKFPAVLLKMLPVSKDKAEAQGAEAVRKVLKKDIDVSIEKFKTFTLNLCNQNSLKTRYAYSVAFALSTSSFRVSC